MLVEIVAKKRERIGDDALMSRLDRPRGCRAQARIRARSSRGNTDPPNRSTKARRRVRSLSSNTAPRSIVPRQLYTGQVHYSHIVAIATISVTANSKYGSTLTAVYPASGVKTTHLLPTIMVSTHPALKRLDDSSLRAYDVVFSLDVDSLGGRSCQGKTDDVFRIRYRCIEDDISTSVAGRPYFERHLQDALLFTLSMLGFVLVTHRKPSGRRHALSGLLLEGQCKIEIKQIGKTHLFAFKIQIASSRLQRSSPLVGSFLSQCLTQCLSRETFLRTTQASCPGHYSALLTKIDHPPL